MNTTRVVITGAGIVSCIGNSVQEFWDSLLAGKSGIGPITRFDAEAYRTRIGGEVKDLDLTKLISPKEAKLLTRSALPASIRS